HTNFRAKPFAEIAEACRRREAESPPPWAPPPGQPGEGLVRPSQPLRARRLEQWIHSLQVVPDNGVPRTTTINNYILSILVADIVLYNIGSTSIVPAALQYGDTTPVPDNRIVINLGCIARIPHCDSGPLIVDNYVAEHLFILTGTQKYCTPVI